MKRRRRIKREFFTNGCHEMQQFPNVLAVHKSCFLKRAASVLNSALLLFVCFQAATVHTQSLYGNTVNVAAKVREKDKEGNTAYAPYKDFATLLVDSLKGFKQTPAPKLDKYGGNATKRIAGNGFFRVMKQGGRWWCVTPEGHPYLNIAVNSINRGGSERNAAAFAQTFGSEEKWMVSTVSLLHENGFSSGGSWSDIKAITNYNKTASRPLAYCINWNFMSQYGKARGGTFQVPGHTGYPGNVIFVFDPAFPTFCDSLAKQTAAYKSDKALFGYFSDNEMPFNVNNLEGYLSLPETDHGYIAAKAWLTAKGINKDQITEQHKKDFLAYEAERYFSIVSASLRKYDPNHLYLGCRLYSSEKNVPEFMQTAGRFLDVVSINYYGAWTPSALTMNNWAAWSGRPFIVTEYYVKGEDAGLANTSGAGWIVKTQADRGAFYQNFCMGLLRSDACVGWHWFKYQDNDPAQKGAEPSNTDANKGLVDNDYKVYMPLAERMKVLNLNSYALIDYFKGKSVATKDLDLYLLIGQSNMAGRGEITGKYKTEGSDSVFMLSKDDLWTKAVHPLHFDKPLIAGVGPGLRFGLEMAKTTHHKIGLIPCAVGGTSIDAWVPDGYDKATNTHPYDDAVKRLRLALLSGNLKGIIWLQGESDSDPVKAKDYLPKLTVLIQRLRSLASDKDLPFVAGEIGRFKEQYGNINSQLKALAITVPYTTVVTSENLADKGDSIHFDAPSADEYGKRFAEGMKSLLHN